MVGVPALVHALLDALVNLGMLRNRAPGTPAHSPKPGIGLVRHGVGILAVLRELRLVQLQAAALRVGEHPVQGDVRQPAFVVPAADIGMNAREPDLLQRLARLHRLLIPK